MEVPSQRSWEVVGYDGMNEIFRRSIPVNLITVKKLRALLQTLAAKRGHLDDDDVVACFLTRGSSAHRDFLEVTSENVDAERRTNYYCGGSVHFAARLTG